MAVYTRLSFHDMQGIIARYDLGKLCSFQEIAEGVENSNFLVITQKGSEAPLPSILTLYEKRTNPQDLPFFLGLMEHLACAGIPCPTPYTTNDGSDSFVFENKTGAMVSFLTGKSKLAADTTVNDLAQLGTLIGKMQRATQDFTLTRSNDLSVEGWKRLTQAIGKRADEIQDGLARILADEIAFLSDEWPQHLPRGIIHADIFPDNIFFEGEQLSGIIDFYFACEEITLYELAITMNAWCFDAQGQLLHDKARALLNAYTAQKPLSEEEIKNFGILCRGAALRFLLTRSYDWLHHDASALVTAKDPNEYLAKLRYLQQEIRDVQDMLRDCT